MTESQYKNLCHYMQDKENEICCDMEQLFPSKESRKSPQYQVFKEKYKMWSLRTIYVQRLYQLEKLKNKLQDIIEEQNELEMYLHECESNLGEISTSKEIENGKSYTIHKNGLLF